jgi:hypothetical protein|tara:strand:+ start:2337 stop:3218 length:882 start_codon:yes stop_codon:yes gene_type:complete
MLGYFKPLKEELKMKDYYNYRSFYCGHCHILKKEYSRFSSILMSYEAVFISLLFTTKIINQKKKIRCTALPIIKVPIYDNEAIRLSILINQIFIYAKIKDKIYDNEWYGYKFIDFITLKGKKKTKNNLKKINMDTDKIFDMLEHGQTLETEKLEFIEYIQPYKEAMEYIFTQAAHHFRLDKKLYESLGGNFLTLMYLLDAGDDYYEDIKNNRFTPLNKLAENDVQQYFEKQVPTMLDNIVKIIFQLKHPYEIIILNILGEYINSEKYRIIKRLRNKGASNDDKSKLLRYFRSI